MMGAVVSSSSSAETALNGVLMRYGTCDFAICWSDLRFPKLFIFSCNIPDPTTHWFKNFVYYTARIPDGRQPSTCLPSSIAKTRQLNVVINMSKCYSLLRFTDIWAGSQ